ncbi:hypothetical protein [Polyangium aurulentum]|uniref:hypothetical protein n=1 Tax=Polyangium aurulentum TaxID=2567896 RepID=UPI0010AE193A|nr:hypothetical protein [Polyangium aurulentum]UQA55968.1 hypothetical protein E8A73_032215 [Polyangium aurulentum]
MTVRRILSIVSMTLSLAAVSCVSHEVTVREPIDMAAYPADAYVATNMLVANHIRMALPDRWNFKKKEKDDDKSTWFQIEFNGRESVRGAFRFNHFEFPVSLNRVSEKYGDLAMSKFIEKELHRTEIDQKDAFVIFGKLEEPSLQRASTVIALDESNLAEITLVGESQYFTTKPQLAYAISNTFKIMPGDLSERRLKGTFSFKCDDGTMRWVDDVLGPYRSKGFSVGGRLDNGYVLLGVAQVATTRFNDVVKQSQFDVPEFETDLRFAGATYRARAIAHTDLTKNFMHSVFFIKHQGQDYLVTVFRGYDSGHDTDAKEMHTVPAIQEALDKYFYFFNG